MMVKSAGKLVNSWESLIEIGGGIAQLRVDDYITRFTSRVISKAMNNYSEGNESFPKCRALMKACNLKQSSRDFPSIGMCFLTFFSFLKFEKDICISQVFLYHKFHFLNLFIYFLPVK